MSVKHSPPQFQPAFHGERLKGFREPFALTTIGVYAATLVAAACVLTALIAMHYGLSEHGSAWPLVAFALLAVLTEHQSVRLTPSIEISVTFLPLLFVAVVFGPFAAGLVGAVTLLSDFGRPYTRWLVWGSTRILVGGVAGIAATEVYGWGSSQSTSIVFSTGAAAVVMFSLDMALGWITLALRGTGSARDLIRVTAPVAAAAAPIYTAMIALIAYAYIEITPWTAALFFVPALAAHRLFALYREQQDAVRSLAEANAALEEANLSFATALVATLDARDRYTAGHSAAVAIYARDIAARLGLDEHTQHLAHLCGLVHDIGKIGLPPGLLEKPGPLTLAERRQMEKHSEIGESILGHVKNYSHIAKIVRHHHERMDGEGYPDGLQSDEIPLISRILAVADSYDAMTSDRPYRDAMPSRVARFRLAQAVEAQFDTSIVAAFEAILVSASDDYRTGNRKDFGVTEEHLQAAVHEKDRAEPLVQQILSQ
jgi:putative nucleotidyltransferase with HDIG domain